MRRPITQFLLVAMLTTPACSYLSAQNTKKTDKVDPLEEAVRKYEARLSQLEDLLKRELEAHGKVAAKRPQGKNGSANGGESSKRDKAAALRRQQDELARVQAQHQIASLKKSLAEANGKNQRLAATLNSQLREQAALNMARASLLEQNKRGVRAIAELAKSNKNIVALAQSLQTERQQHAALKKNHATSVDRSEQAAAILNAKLADQATQNRRQASLLKQHKRGEQAIAELAGARKNSADLTRSLTAERKQHVDLQKLHAASVDRSKQAEANSNAAVQRADRTRRELADVQARHAKLVSQGKKAESVLVDALRQVDKVKGEVANAQARNQQLADQLAQQKSRTASAEQARAAAEVQLKKQATLADRSHDELAAVRQLTAKLEGLLNSSRKTLQAAAKDLDARLAKAEVAVSKAQILIKENQAQAAALRHAKERESELTVQLRVLRDELAAVQSANDSLRQAQEDAAEAPPAPVRGTTSGGFDQSIKIYNQGGTIIINQGGNGTLQGRARDASAGSTRVFQPGPSLPRSQHPARKTPGGRPAGRSKTGTELNARSRAKSPTTIRRINF